MIKKKKEEKDTKDIINKEVVFYLDLFIISFNHHHQSLF